MTKHAKRGGEVARNRLSEEAVGQPVPAALGRDAETGSRIITLHWLHRLCAARADWDASMAIATNPLDGESTPPGATLEQSLHSARVALRRLRASIREYSTKLRVGKKVRRALRKLNEATNAARDADVWRAWLVAEMDSLDRAASIEAAELLDGIEQEREQTRKRVGKAFRNHLDPVLERLMNALEHLERRQSIAPDNPTQSFAALVAQQLAAGTDDLLRVLGERICLDVGDAPMHEELHKLRINLKRQRALIAPFSEWHPSLSEWYKMATRGQDSLGAMRDASGLMDIAVDRGKHALAGVLASVSRSHEEAFRNAWCVEGRADQSVAQFSLHAVTALRSLDESQPAPMEIERKYLLNGVPPETRAFAPVLIQQGWLPGVVLRERLRKTTRPDGEIQFTRTIKAGPLGARVELEEDAEQTLFEALWPFTAHARIRKHRHCVPHHSATWEIDVFVDRDLVLAEVELHSERDKPDIPAWLAPYIVRDVTEDPRFTNSAMATAENKLSEKESA